ncbi:MAG TPA: YihY/virulence factor BrkB family protein [Burkholderiales bacterium]|nr:YihY/virulence factor BrkB family protein [Burkholderiales bacterium]
MRLPLKKYLGLLKETAASWSADYAPSMGAAISYYTLFSVAPLLLIVIAVAGMVFGAEAARGEVFAQLQGLLGESGAKTVEDMVDAANKQDGGIIATIIGIAVLLLGATTVFNELQNALDRIWRAPARVKSSGVWNLLRTRLLSFGMVLGMAFLLMVSLVASAALSALGKWWTPAGWEAVMHVLDIVVSFGLITVMFALIYRFIPRVHVAWRDVWVGAAVTSILFAIGKFAIGLYLGKSAVASSFGAAGSLVIMMVWVYYSAQIFLFGAEFTWVYAHEFGSRRGQERPKPGAEAVPERGKDEAVEHRHFPLPAHAAHEPIVVKQAANPLPVRERRGLRRRHPFGMIGSALVAGVVLGAAKSLLEERGFRGLRRHSAFPGSDFFHGLKRRWT